MERHLNENELALYVDGLKLHRVDSVPAELRVHVEGCIDCKQAIMEIASAVPEQAYRGGEPHPFFDRKPAVAGWIQKFDPVLRWAAGILLLVGAGSLVYIVAFNTTREGSRAGQVQAVQPASPELSQKAGSREGGEPLAAADPFKPSPLYERLTTEQLRSGRGASHRPANGDTLGADQLFRWSGGSGRGAYTVTIVDNRGREAARSTVTGETYRLTERLPVGLYYWKVEQAGELVFTGKFYAVP